MLKKIYRHIFLSVAVTGIAPLNALGETPAEAATPPGIAGENRLANIRQLTFGGQNAEAYFSYDGDELIFQSTRDELECDAIFRMRVDGSEVRQVSSGHGVTTCAFIAPDSRSIIYASTHRVHRDCPPKPDYSSPRPKSNYSQPKPRINTQPKNYSQPKNFSPSPKMPNTPSRGGSST